MLRTIFVVLFIIYTLLVSYLSLAPLESESVPQIWDKAAHAIAYSGFAVLSYLVSNNKKQLLLLLVACFFYGISIELLQGLTSYRLASWQDQIANTTGLLIGYLAIKLFFRFFPQPQSLGYR